MENILVLKHPSRDEILKDNAEKLKAHIGTLEKCISNPLLANHIEENKKYLKIAMECLLKIENEILLYKKVQ